MRRRLPQMCTSQAQVLVMRAQCHASQQKQRERALIEAHWAARVRPGKGAQDARGRVVRRGRTGRPGRQAPRARGTTRHTKRPVHPLAGLAPRPAHRAIRWVSSRTPGAETRRTLRAQTPATSTVNTPHEKFICVIGAIFYRGAIGMAGIMRQGLRRWTGRDESWGSRLERQRNDRRSGRRNGSPE